MSKLYEGPVQDTGSKKKTPSSGAELNGEPGMTKRSSTSTGVPEVTYDEYDVLPKKTK